MEQNINKMVDLAKEGNADAIEWLIKQMQDPIYALAVKMLYSISDAEDASQEILIKIITRLCSFQKKSSFNTWTMRIAVNHLLNNRKSQTKKRFTFQSCEDMIVRDVPDQSTVIYSEAEQGLLVDEIRVICVQGLLQCLDWNHRIVYVLCQTMDISGSEGSAILGITPSNFRKRFSRAKKQIRRFLQKNCELFNSSNHCKCIVQSMFAVDIGLIDPLIPRHMTHPVKPWKKKEITHRLRELEDLARETALMRIHPDYAAPGAFIERIKEMIGSGRFQKLKNIN